MKNVNKIYLIVLFIGIMCASAVCSYAADEVTYITRKKFFRKHKVSWYDATDEQRTDFQGELKKSRERVEEKKRLRKRREDKKLRIKEKKHTNLKKKKERKEKLRLKKIKMKKKVKEKKRREVKKKMKKMKKAIKKSKK